MIAGVDLIRYGNGLGKIVMARPGGTLADLQPKQVMNVLAETGFLLFRGFEPGLEEFSDFVRAHSDRVTLDPARTFFGGNVAQKVDAGVEALGLHIENGNSPFVPTLTWFLCEKAARSGSQTTVCDGYTVWEKFSPQARSAFKEQDIVFTRRVSEPMWKAFTQYQLAEAKDVDDITTDDVRSLATGPGHTAFRLDEDGYLTYAYRTPAVHPTLFGRRQSFANSILGPSYNYEPPKITFADGSDLPEWLWDEVRDVTESVTQEINWVDGDVVLVDNTRAMHGRRAVEDTDRSIYNSQSYAAAHLLNALGNQFGECTTEILPGVPA